MRTTLSYKDVAWLLLFLILVSGCTTQSQFISNETRNTGFLSDESIALNASSAALPIKEGVVLTDNDDAFQSKLALIESAETSIDLAYYIYADDYTSSTLSKALLDAANRGVKVRMLLDYHSNYKNLDMFSMLESESASAGGNIEVRFYNRPTEHIIQDAAYLTLGCGSGSPNFAECSDNKIDSINKAMSSITEASSLSNLNIAGSGLFLSGLYGKNPALMATAIQEGYDLDPSQLSPPSNTSKPENLEKLAELGTIYFKSRYGNAIERLTAKLQLGLAFTFYGDQVDPVYHAFSAFLPVEQADRPKQAQQDWQFLTDFLHHKFLLIDGHKLQLGGRNVEDSYHMSPNPLAAKYLFIDTDIRLELQQNVTNHLTAGFEKLWNFRTMVATINDIRQHAPNDILAATQAASTGCQDINNEAENEACLNTAFDKNIQNTIAQRHRQWKDKLDRNQLRYLQDYSAATPNLRSPTFNIDKTAAIYYLENLPFDKTLTTKDNPRPLQRIYGSENSLEGDHGKHIHALWLALLNNTCALADETNPQEIIIHNAYFLLPSNLFKQLAEMIDGTRDCAHVSISIITNSIETTDLNIVNIFARHAMKAFFEYIDEHAHPQRGAHLDYFEYTVDDSSTHSQLSLHSKVMVFGNDLFIGSANADVRSYMMDTNNGLLIRHAPQLLSNYTNWVHNLYNSGRVVKLNDYFIQTPRETILAQDLATIDSIMATYRADRWITTEEEMADLKAKFSDVLNTVYLLSHEIVADKRKTKASQEKFNALFKGI